MNNNDSLGSLDQKASAILADVATTKQDITRIDRKLQLLRGTSEQTSQALPVIHGHTSTIISETQTVKENVANVERQLQRYEPLLMLLPLIHTGLEVLQPNFILNVITNPH